MQHSLTLRIFLLITALLIGFIALTCAGVLIYTPHVYRHAASEAQELTDQLAEMLGHLDSREAPYAINQMADLILERTEDEYILHIFDRDGAELSIPSLAAAGSGLQDYASLEQTESRSSSPQNGQPVYTVLAVQNAELESQAAAALEKSLPGLGAAVAAAAAVAALLFSIGITSPIRKISAASEKMAALDFDTPIPVRRSDEIGTLARNLRHLSSSLHTALSDLQTANLQLRADMKHREELEQQRAEFFSAASHELKTPITIIRGQLEGMIGRVGRYRDRDTYLKKALHETEKLQSMVQDLLLLSRLDGPGYVPATSEFSLTDLVQQETASLQDLWEIRGVQVIQDLQKAEIRADRSLIRRMLENLLVNAAMYSSFGGCVHISIQTQDTQIVLAIENNCTPLSETSLARLFDPLYRADPARSRQTGGTGLGLYIVQTIARLHQASVTAENTDQGLRITLLFPTTDPPS